MTDETLFEQITRQAHEIADRINEPGKESVYFPRFKGRPLEGFKDYKDDGFVAQVTNYHAEILGRDVSKRTGQTWIPLTLQTTIDEVMHDGNVRNVLSSSSYWIQNGGALLKKGFYIARPEVVNRDGKPAYEGEKVKATIDTNNLVVTLQSAGVLRESAPRIIGNTINFDDNGIASGRSSWDPVGGVPDADAVRPLARDDYGVAAFELVGKKKELEMPEAKKVDAGLTA